MTGSEIASLIASVVSVAIAMLAIWLSIVFYRMSTEQAEKSRDAAKSIAASVERLETLFNRLYSDTFAMMKDTVSDMRKHIWPETGSADELAKLIDTKTAERMDQIRAHVGAEIMTIIGEVGKTDERVKELQADLGTLMNRAITETLNAERSIREETLREKIASIIRAQHDPISALEIFLKLGGDTSPSEMSRELRSMKEERLVVFSDTTKEGTIDGSTLVRAATTVRLPPTKKR